MLNVKKIQYTFDLPWQEVTIKVILKTGKHSFFVSFGKITACHEIRTDSRR